MVGFADETIVGGRESVGARLRHAREAHGLSLNDVAARTRVPTRHLQAIEEDAFDRLPAAPYSVGFAKAFADAVGLNRDEIGREFRAEKEGYGTAEAMPSSVQQKKESAGFPRGWIVLIILLIAAVATGLWWSGMLGGSKTVETPAEGPAPAAPAAVPETPPPAPMALPSVNNGTGTEAVTPSSQKKPSSAARSEGTNHAMDSKTEGETGTTKATEGSGKNASEEKSAKASEKKSSSPVAPTGIGEAAKANWLSTRDLNRRAQQSSSHAAPPAEATTQPAVAAPPIISAPPPPLPPAPDSGPSGTAP